MAIRTLIMSDSATGQRGVVYVQIFFFFISSSRVADIFTRTEIKKLTRNIIIVSNSNNSEWLYIVKAGSCVILKKLKGVIPKHFLSTPKTSDLELLPDLLQAIVFDIKLHRHHWTAWISHEKNFNPAKKRTYYGLDTVTFEDDIQRTNTAFTLVSRGAECIMLSKAFYAKHANAKVKRWMKESTRPYPDEDVFQENLQIKEDWMLYKKTMLDDMTNRVKKTSHRLDSK